MDGSRRLPDEGWKVSVEDAIGAASEAWAVVQGFNYEEAVGENRAQELRTFLATVAAVYHLGLMDDDGLKMIGQSILLAAANKESWAIDSDGCLTDETYKVIVEAFMPMTRPLKLLVHHLASESEEDFVSDLRGDGVKLCMDSEFIGDTEDNIAFFRDLPEDGLDWWLNYLDERRDDFNYGKKVAKALTHRICVRSAPYKRADILYAMALVFTPTDTIGDEVAMPESIDERPAGCGLPDCCGRCEECDKQ